MGLDPRRSGRHVDPKTGRGDDPGSGDNAPHGDSAHEHVDGPERRSAGAGHHDEVDMAHARATSTREERRRPGAVDDEDDVITRAPQANAVVQPAAGTGGWSNG